MSAKSWADKYMDNMAKAGKEMNLGLMLLMMPLAVVLVIFKGVWFHVSGRKHKANK